MISILIHTKTRYVKPHLFLQFASYQSSFRRYLQREAQVSLFLSDLMKIIKNAFVTHSSKIPQKKGELLSLGKQSSRDNNNGSLLLVHPNRSSSSQEYSSYLGPFSSSSQGHIVRRSRFEADIL